MKKWGSPIKVLGACGIGGRKGMGIEVGPQGDRDREGLQEREEREVSLGLVESLEGTEAWALPKPV